MEQKDVVFKCSSKAEDDAEEIYIGNATAQAWVKHFSLEWNKVNPNYSIEVISSGYLSVSNENTDLHQKATYWTIEKVLKGSFTKWNCNDGTFNEDEKGSEAFNIANAFSHWTWKYSNRTVIALDIQGVNRIFTDCVIVSALQKFGYDDMGQESIDKFFDNHECNEICRSMDLDKYSIHPNPPKLSTSTRRLS
jgi:hypothetical protein